MSPIPPPSTPVLDALKQLAAEVKGAREELRSLKNQVASSLHRDFSEHRPPARSSPNLIDPEATPHGGIRLPPGGWEMFQAKLDGLSKRLDEEAAEKKGAQKALAELDARFARWRSIITFAIAVGTPIAALVGWLAHR